jgi:predicted porin
MKINVAVLLAFGALASIPMVSQAEVTLYGRANISVDHVDPVNPVAGQPIHSDTVFTDNNSRVGVKGFEKLGNGLKAVFQVESKVHINSKPGSADWAGRDKFVGLSSHQFGTITAGRHFSLQKQTNDLDPFGDSLGDYNAIISEDSAAKVDFNDRFSNSLRYLSPKFNHIQFGALYSRDVDSVANKKNVYELMGKYKAGPLEAALVYSDHKAADTGYADAKETKLALGYTFAATKLAFIADHQKGASGSAVNHNAYELAATQNLGGGNFVKGAYITAQDSDVGNDGANMWVIGAEHHFSKWTQVYAEYARLKNDPNAHFGYDPYGSNDVAGVTQKGLTLGMKKYF